MDSIKKTLSRIKKACASSVLPIAICVILLSYQNCGDVNLISPESVLAKTCAELEDSVPSYIQVGLVDGAVKAFINELVVGDSNEVVKSTRIYEWSLEGASSTQSFQDSEISLPEIADGDCSTTYIVRAQISVCDNTIQFEPVEYTNLNCATPTPTPGPTATPTPTATPPVPPTVTTTIPGWTNVPPSPNSCPVTGQPLPTSPEPQIPLACLSIPGRDAARPYPQVYLGFDELENGGLPPFGDPPEFMSAAWWNSQYNNGIFTRDMSWTHIDQAPRVCEANRPSLPIQLGSSYQYVMVTNKYYSIRFTPSAGDGGLIYLESGNVESPSGLVSISECPGDFGEIHDTELMRQIGLNGSQQSLPTPIVNTRNTNRTLFYQAAGEKTYNQYIPPTSQIKIHPFERCIKRDPKRGFELAYKTINPRSTDSRVNNGCLLQAGKTYYINMVSVNGYNNRQYYPDTEAVAILTGITPY